MLNLNFRLLVAQYRSIALALALSMDWLIPWAKIASMIPGESLFQNCSKEDVNLLCLYRKLPAKNTPVTCPEAQVLLAELAKQRVQPS